MNTGSQVAAVGRRVLEVEQNALPAAENALCELSEEVMSSISDIENALCELSEGEV